MSTETLIGAVLLAICVPLFIAGSFVMGDLDPHALTTLELLQ